MEAARRHRSQTQTSKHKRDWKDFASSIAGQPPVAPAELKLQTSSASPYHLSGGTSFSPAQ